MTEFSAAWGSRKRAVEPGNARGPAGWREQRGQDLDGRRFAGAVGTEQAEQLARRDAEADAVHRAGGLFGFAVDLDQVTHLDDRCVVHPSSRKEPFSQVQTRHAGGTHRSADSPARCAPLVTIFDRKEGAHG